MSKTTEQLIRIVSAGGGIIIDGSNKTTDQLIRIVSNSAAGQIIITNIASKTTDQLVRIASAGNNVIFDLR